MTITQRILLWLDSNPWRTRWLGLLVKRVSGYRPCPGPDPCIYCLRRGIVDSIDDAA